MSAWRCRLEVRSLPRYPQTLNMDIYLPLPPAIPSLYRLSRLITSEVDRVLGYAADTVIIDTIRAWWPYDWRTRTGDSWYRLEDEGIEDWRWMLEEVRREGGHLDVAGRIVRRYLPVHRTISRTRSRSRSRSRLRAEHNPYGTCPVCRGVCVQGVVSPEPTRRPSRDRRSLGCGPGCLACFGDGRREMEENEMESVHGR